MSRCIILILTISYLILPVHSSAAVLMPVPAAPLPLPSTPSQLCRCTPPRREVVTPHRAAAALDHPGRVGPEVARPHSHLGMLHPITHRCSLRGGGPDPPWVTRALLLLRWEGQMLLGRARGGGGGGRRRLLLLRWGWWGRPVYVVQEEVLWGHAPRGQESLSLRCRWLKLALLLEEIYNITQVQPW